jgi:hypothetical protein
LNAKKRNIYLYPLLAAIIVRLAAIPFIDSSKIALLEYGTIARNLLAGFGYAFSWLHSGGNAVILPTAYMPPGQVFIQYALLGIFGDSQSGIIALYLFQIAEACGFVYLIGLVTELLFTSEKATVATIWLAALYPSFIYVTLSFGVTSSALLLNALTFYMAIRFSESLGTGKGSLKFALLLGMSCGLLLLWRGESPLIIISTLALIAYLNKDKFRRSFLYIGLAALIAITILAPWTIRNYLVFNRFIPISTNGGFNFWRGNNSVTTGSPWTETGGPLWSTDEIWTELEPSLDKKGDFDKINSDIHTREAFKWIRENPEKFALQSLKKGVMLWTFDLRSKLGGTAAYIAFYACTLAGLLIGIFYIRRNKIGVANEYARAGFRIMILWCILMTLVAMIFIPLQRFQVLLVGIYLPVIGYGIPEILKRKALTIQSKETGAPIVS